MKNREAYIQKMKQQLDDLNKSMIALEDKAHEAKGDAADKYKAAMREVRAQSQSALDNLSELTAAGEATWDATMARMEKVRDAFIHSFHYFKSQV